MLFLKGTQSESLKKTKFGASLFSPMGKEMGGKGGLQGGGWWCRENEDETERERERKRERENVSLWYRKGRGVTEDV